MTLYRATIDILIEAESPFRAMDGVAEMLLPLAEGNELRDWQYAPEQGDHKVKVYLKPREISPDSAERHFDDFEVK